MGRPERSETDKNRVETLLNGLSSMIRLNDIFGPHLLDEGEICSILSAEVSRLLSVDAGVYLIEGDMLRLAAYHGSDASRPPEPGSHFPSNIPQEGCVAMKRGFPAIYSGGEPGNCYCCRELQVSSQFRVCVPHQLGVVIADSYEKAFSSDEFNILVGMVGLTSNAIQRGRLIKELEEKINTLQRIQERMVEAEKMEAMGRLAGGIAHDFNNLLVAVIGYSEMAGSMAPDGSDLKKYIDNILKAGERAKALTNQILAFSRRQIFELQDIAINRLISDFSDMLRSLLTEGIELELSLCPDPPNIKADPHQIEQVIMNLAANARDAMSDRGRLTIRTEPVRLDKDTAARLDMEEGDCLLLSVSDTGTGIPDEVKAHIFEPFFTTKGPGKGTGLGLASAYGIVRQHKGAIEVETEVGRGSTFRVYLPASPRSEEVQPLKAEPSDLSKGSGHILIVEDNESVLSFLETILTGLGYTVTALSDGMEALRLLEKGEGPYDLLITDIVMPHMDGKELARGARSLRPEMKVLFISGYPQERLQVGGVLEKGINFLKKPFTAHELSMMVRKALSPHAQ